MTFLAALLLTATPRSIGPKDFIATEPQVAMAGKHAYVACGRGDRLFVLASSDRGGTFSNPVVLPAGGKLSLGMRRGPRIAALGQSVVVSAVYGQQGGGQDGDLLAWRSSDGGKTWKGPARVSDTPGAAREGLHGMGVSPKGALACAWLDLRDKGTEIWCSVSRDGGATWAKNVRVYRSPSGTVCECCHPSVAYAPDGRFYVMFRNSLAGNRDMYLASSSDGGKTFASARKLGTGTWPLNACPMDGGALAVRANGTVETVWRRADRVFLCQPGKPERELGAGIQPWMASGSKGDLVVWQGPDGIRAKGVSGPLPAGTDPAVAADGGHGLAVWADGAGRVWSLSLG